MHFSIDLRTQKLVRAGVPERKANLGLGIPRAIADAVIRYYTLHNAGQTLAVSAVWKILQRNFSPPMLQLTAEALKPSALAEPLPRLAAAAQRWRALTS